MSDFDKEAERERLREKYEADQRKRESSERMSDLLLKGATMTNAHCNDCGDPIFRYDGEEFCPTCQRVVTNDEAAEQAAPGAQATGDAAKRDQQPGDADQQPGDADQHPGDADQHPGEADQPSDENGDSPSHIEIKQPDGPAVQTGGTQQGAPSEAGAPSPHKPQDDGPATDPSETGSAAQPSAGADEQTPKSTVSGGTTAPKSRPSPANRETPSEPPDAGDDLDAARASLVRTLRSHAERAESTDDPRRARDHLAAAREAAEALSALSSSY